MDYDSVCRPHTKCRVCNSTDMVEYLDLAYMPICNNLEPTTELAKGKDRFPLVVMFCKECGLSQLSVVVNPELLFSYYTYASGVNQGYKGHCLQMALSLKDRFGLNDKTFHVDIGGNDGSLLLEFQKVLHHEILNVDPSENITDIARSRGVPSITDFWSIPVTTMKIGKRADLLTSTNVFAHLDNVIEFMVACRGMLKKNSILIIENPYLIDFIDNMEWDTCFLPETIILGANKIIKDCAIGDFTYSGTGSLTEITHVFERKYNGEILSINPEYLDKINCTPNHPILVSLDKGKTKEYIKAENIKVGDYLCVPKLKSFDLPIVLDLSEYNKIGPFWRRGLLSAEVNEDFAYLVGLYTADGSSSSDTLSIALSHPQRETIGRKIISIINNLGVKVRVVDRTKYGSKCDTYNFSCVGLLRLFKEKIGTKAHNKVVPDFILNSPSKIKESYLRGLLDGDGYYKDGQIHLHTASKVLAFQVQLLFAEYNIVMGLSYTPPSEYNIMGIKGQSRGNYQLRAKSKIVRKFFGDEKITRFSTKYFYDDEYIYVKVVGIDRKNYDGFVYNLETSEHTYLASNIAVHNCYFEHVTYWSLLPMMRLCKDYGLKVIDAEKQDIHGGTMRYIITREESDHIPSPNVQKVCDEERRRGFDEFDIYSKWSDKVDDHILSIRNGLIELKEQGNTIIGFAASAKGITMLNACGIDDKIMNCIIDETPTKKGKFTPGTGIPIVGIEEIMKINPDYIVILSWNFAEEIMAKVKALGYKGKFITTVPSFTVIE